MDNQICAKFIGGKAHGQKMIIEDCSYFCFNFCNIDWETVSPNSTSESSIASVSKKIRYINSYIRDSKNNYLFYPDYKSVNDFETIKKSYFESVGSRKQTRFLDY